MLPNKAHYSLIRESHCACFATRVRARYYSHRASRRYRSRNASAYSTPRGELREIIANRSQESRLTKARRVGPRPSVCERHLFDSGGTATARHARGNPAWTLTSPHCNPPYPVHVASTAATPSRPSSIAVRNPRVDESRANPLPATSKRAFRANSSATEAFDVARCGRSTSARQESRRSRYTIADR